MEVSFGSAHIKAEGDQVDYAVNAYENESGIYVATTLKRIVPKMYEEEANELLDTWLKLKGHKELTVGDGNGNNT